MRRIIALGDSFVVGDLDDFGPGHNYNPDFPPTHGMGYTERETYLRYNVSFVSLISKQLNYELVNIATRGSGNYRQLDNLMEFISNNTLTPDDIILYGICTTTRDRRSIFIDDSMPHHQQPGACIKNATGQQDADVELYDLFYILSILNQISTTYNVRIIKFNIFDNTLDNFKDSKFIYKTNDFIGQEFKTNTLVDILNDTFGILSNEGKKPYHIHLKIDKDYEKFYTWNKHPSILGHQKLAEWFLRNIDFKK